MRTKFRGYYTPSPEQFISLWDEATFVFDTNVLLNIYRYTPKTQKDFLNILERLHDRIWVPHQVALEYFENREGVMAQQYSIYQEIDSSLDETIKKIVNKYKKGHPFA